MKNSLLSALALAVGISVVPAGAVTISTTTVTLGGVNAGANGMTTPASGASVQNFEAGLPSNFSFNGPGAIVSGSSLNVYKAPTNDTTKYLTTGTGSATATFANGINYLGFYWGSVDTYNTLTLTTTTGVSETFTGSSLPGFTPDSDTSVYANFKAGSGVFWNKAVFSSTQNAFELDNVASQAPEPASLAMIGTGLVALGFGAIRRRKQAEKA